MMTPLANRPRANSHLSSPRTTVRRPSAPDGIVIVDKPQTWTSHDVVSKMRGLAATRKVGHAGTLDPMATGVLVVGIGKATRLLNYIVGADKDYDTTIRIGFGTSTEDADGERITEVNVAPAALETEQVVAAAATLTGDIMQIPSSVSAIKIDGKRAYDRVRNGEDVEIPARPARVERFQITDLRKVETDEGVMWDVDASVTVSSGTYVRALGRDLARALGSEGHLTMLRRTRVGGYSLDQACTLEELNEQLTQAETIDVLPLAQAASATFDVRNLTAEETAALGFGKRLTPVGAPKTESIMAAISPDGALIALLKDDGKKAQPAVVFAPNQ